MKERALIKEILSFLELEDEDAFVFPFHDTLFSVTIDTLVAETDVPEGMTPFQIGWKTAVMNLSDLAAMGASPQYFLCSLTIPGDYPALDIIKGVKAACDTYHCQYVGGDINEGGISASGCAIGTSTTVMRRSGAQPGDHVGLTGDVGRVYAGLKDLVHATPSMRDKIFSPAPRLQEGLTLKAHSCIDISDGLSSELHHIAEASNVRIDVHSDKIPIHNDVVKKAQAESESDVLWALKSGEEYELLFTDITINSQFTTIGEIKKGKGVYLDGEPMPVLGWEHM